MMKNLFQLLGLVLLVKYSYQTCIFPPAEECISTSDPIIQQFDFNDGAPFINFKPIVDNVIMYSDDRNDDNQVTGSFRRCNVGCDMTCNCGIHIRSRDTTLFTDSCGLSNLVDTTITNLTSQIFASYPGEPAVQIDCTRKTVVRSRAYDQSWWRNPSNGVNVNGQLKCARIAGTKTVVVTSTYNTDVLNFFVTLIPAEKSGIAQVKIKAPQHSYRHTKGLCGKWNDIITDDDPGLYLKDGQYIFANPDDPQNSMSNDELAEAVVNAYGTNPVLCCDEDCEKSIAECLVGIFSPENLSKVKFDSDFMVDEEGVPRSQSEAENFCNNLIYDPFIVGIFNEYDLDQSLIQFCYDLCVEAVNNGIADRILNDQFPAILLSEARGAHCEANPTDTTNCIIS